MTFDVGWPRMTEDAHLPLERYYRRKIAILEAEEQRLHKHIDAAWEHLTEDNGTAARVELSEARWGHAPIPLD
jgi:hypothetical protein